MILAVDVGTTVTKSAIVAPDGTCSAVAETPTRLYRPAPGEVEQDLEQVVASVADVSRRSLAQHGGAVDGIAVTAQGDGLWLRDARGRAVRRPISWMDARASDIVAGWSEGPEPTVTTRFFARTGSGLFAGSHAALLTFLSRHEPENLRAAAVAGYCGDAILQRLTGTVTVEASDASLPFLDVRTRKYREDALAMLGLAEWAHLLADPAAVDAIHTLDETGELLLGLPAGTPVVLAPYDLESCAYGCGITAEGDGTVVLGTTLACEVLTPESSPQPGDEPGGMWLCTPEPEAFLRVMPSMVGTASIDWMLATLRRDVFHLDEMLTRSGVGAHGVRALSQFSPAGERAPFVEPRARGQFLNLSIDATADDLVRALTESIAFTARLCLETSGLSGELSATGGGLRSPAIAQLFADALDRELLIPHETLVGARGAALLAYRRLGIPFDEAPWRAARRAVEPDSSAAERYRSLYEQFLADLASARVRWRSE